MRRPLPTLLLGLAALVLCASARSLTAAETERNAGPPSPGANELPAIAPPRPVFGVSPVDFFRALLKMTPAEREAALAGRPPAQVKSLLAKAAEYEAMSEAERKIKLRLVSLRYYLAPLMRLATANRAGLLATIPGEDRPLVDERLRLWDRVPQHLQGRLLENEATLQYFLRLDFTNAGTKAQHPAQPPPPDQTPVDLAVAQWKSYPPVRRRQMSENFHQFFELSEPDRAKTLNLLGETERRQMDDALHKFASLPPEERDRCIESFRKFAGMSQPERDQFLRNAERWRKMSAADRQTWRELVEKLPAVPPLPPGLDPVPMPPMPSPPPIPPPEP